MGSQFVEAVNQMSGCMGYTVLFRARSKCLCCIYHLCISHYKLSTCTNTPHWGLTKKSRYKEGVPCQSGNPQPLQVTIRCTWACGMIMEVVAVIQVHSYH